MQGEELLKYITELNSKKAITKINDRIFHLMGYGASNAIAIIGDTSIIMVDGFNKVSNAHEAMEALAQQTEEAKKPVKTLIYTHQHIDHMGGSGAFRETLEEVIGFTPAATQPQHYDRIAAGLGKRSMRQFGFNLTAEEGLSMGLGAFIESEGAPERPDAIAPTTLYDDVDRVERTIDGVRIELVRAPGETDDQIFVWLPDDQVICTGDNYYACWPNLYAIRGTNYRDIATWVDSLTRILSMPATALLPGHSAPLVGVELIQEQVGTYRDAIEYVLMQTLDCINKCMTLDETVAAVQLPEKWKKLPYLAECYGTVEWSVKGIFAGYVGWFDGDPVALMPARSADYQAELLGLIGRERVVERVQQLMANEEYQLALELLQMVDEPALKKECLIGRAKQMTSANGRHYLWSCAKDIEAWPDER